MDVNVGRYNDKMKDFMPYQSHFRHGEAKHFFDRFHPQATHAPNLIKPYYFHTGNKWNTMMNANGFIPCMYSEPNIMRYPPPSKQRFTNQDENNIVKTSNKSENVVSATLKEKTPMCLVNEIARFNKIDQKYILINEEGPAHKKTFFVTLKLGDETFSSCGQSIKKARHSAALEALKNTKHKKPPVKSVLPPADSEDTNPSMTPTVELNSIAMKKGEAVSYEVVGGFKSTKPQSGGDAVDCSRAHNPAFVVKLSMGGKQYFGEGYSVQRARHSAATKAINTFKGGSPDDDAVKELQKEVQSHYEDNRPAPDNKGSSCRSEVSRVHEIAFKKKFKTTFNVTSESGPAHMRTYVTTCECGTFKTTGEGNSKKTSKQKAAEKMLQELNSLSPLPHATNKPPNRFKSSKVEHPKAVDKTFHKVLKANPDFGAGINAVSRLIQIQQAKKLAEPSFLLLEERGSSRDKEFHVQVTVGDKTCSTWASNKKLAKRNAAEKMLQMLGYSRNSNQSVVKKVTFSDVNNVAELMGLLDVKEMNQEMNHNEHLTPSNDVLASFEAI